MKSIFIILTISVAVSYGWGMRGSLLGGLSGATLPGALLGMFLAIFSGNDVIADNFYIFAAAGASAMSFGGSETYGQTLGFITHHYGEDYNPKKGYIGVFLKGALWQGITGFVLGITFSAVSGKYYSGYDIIITFLLIPFVSLLGENLFNKPYNKKEKRFPKIYFSIDRREEWGGNLLILLMLLILTVIRKDLYALLFGLVGILGGGAGFSLGMVLFDFINPNKPGKVIGGKYNKYLSGWKAMEFTFGAVAGLFFAVYFVVTKDNLLSQRIGEVKTGLPIITSPLIPYAGILTYISLALVPLIKLVYLFENKIGEHTCDLIERPVLFTIPMLLAVSGCELSAKLNAFALLVFLASEKVIFERNEKADIKKKVLFGIVFGACTAISVLLSVFTEIPFIAYILMYTLFYIIADNASYVKPTGSRITVLCTFAIQTLYLTVTSIIIT